MMVVITMRYTESVYRECMEALASAFGVKCFRYKAFITETVRY